MAAPKWISPKHVADLETSGLTRETWGAAGLYTERSADEIAKQLGWKYSAKKLGECLAFPYFAIDGAPFNYVRFKPDKPRKHRTTKKIVKYEAPAGRAPRAYFPPLTRACLESANEVLWVEGEKKALSLSERGFAVVGLSGVWSWSTDNELLTELQNIEWAGRKLFIVFDSDRSENEKVRNAESALAAVLTDRGATVRVVELQPSTSGEKTGADDFFVRGGTVEQFRELLAQAVVPTQVELQPKPRKGRASILVGVDEHRVNDQAVAALTTDADIYSRGGQLVRVVNDDEPGTAAKIAYPPGPRILPISKPTLRERFTSVADWYRREKDKFLPISPPTSAVEAVLDRGTWSGVRRLVSIVEYPVMLPDGKILATPGYDCDSGLMYVPRVPVDLNISDRPTLDDAKRALAELREVVSEFPFAAEHHLAAWLAALLTLLARFAFRGCAPLFLAVGNVPGCGKGLLMDTLALIVRACGLAVTTLPDDGNELRKRITSILIRGCPMILFDNLAGRLGCPELDALITSETWSDRLLGESRMVDSLPVLTTWLATGNNVSVIGDTLRRVCPIRLDSPHERPEERTDIQRTDLRGWVMENRPRLLSAALTILRAYHVAGRPDMKLQQWGSFENWSTLVRGAVVWVGLPDPYKGREAMREDGGDDHLTAMGGLLKNWESIDPEAAGLTSANIVKNIDSLPDPNELAEVLLVLAGDRPDRGMTVKPDKRSTTLGYRIRQYAGRAIGGKRIVRAGMSAGVKRWKAEKADLFCSPASSGGGGHGANGVHGSHPSRNGREQSHNACAHPRVEVAGNINTIQTIDTTPDLELSDFSSDRFDALRM